MALHIALIQSIGYLCWDCKFKCYNLYRHLQKVKVFFFFFCKFRKILEAALQHAAVHTLYNW